VAADALTLTDSPVITEVIIKSDRIVWLPLG